MDYSVHASWTTDSAEPLREHVDQMKYEFGAKDLSNTLAAIAPEGPLFRAALDNAELVRNAMKGVEKDDRDDLLKLLSEDEVTFDRQALRYRIQGLRGAVKELEQAVAACREILQTDFDAQRLALAAEPPKWPRWLFFLSMGAGIVALLVLVLAFTRPENFADGFGVNVLANLAATVGMIALGATFVLFAERSRYKRDLPRGIALVRGVFALVRKVLAVASSPEPQSLEFEELSSELLALQTQVQHLSPDARIGSFAVALSDVLRTAQITSARGDVISDRSRWLMIKYAGALQEEFLRLHRSGFLSLL